MYIFHFDHKHSKAPKDLKDLLGGKGANLAEMASVLKMPVPYGFTISTEACRQYIKSGWPKGLSKELEVALSKLEKKMGKKLGDPSNPLLVSVRSGAKFSMPGMMDTVLNLGLNDKSVIGLANQTKDERFAFDSYRRFISMFGRIVLNIDGLFFDEKLEELKEKISVKSDSEIPVDQLKELVKIYKAIVEKETKTEFPQDPRKQLRMAIEAVFSSWNSERAKTYRKLENIPDDLGTAVNVQAMVFGNMGNDSGTGVGFTRNPATGEKGAYGDYLENAQGEDVVAGIRNTHPLNYLEKTQPRIFKELLSIFKKLEAHYRDMCDTEFTVEKGKLWMLQTRVGKRTGAAAIKMAVDMVKDSHIKLTKEEALMRVSASQLEQVLHPQLAKHNHPVLAKGLGASPGGAVGKVVLSAPEAIEETSAGNKVILVRPETSPDDISGMIVSEGILTARGGLVSHAAVVARGWGKPAVVGCEQIKIEKDGFIVGTTHVKKGEVISIDGSTGEVVLGEVELTRTGSSKELATLLKWADEIRGGFSVRTNADTAQDASVARNLGAKGIGLCRTEHMFLNKERLPIVRKMILAQSPEEEAEALKELKQAQKDDFLGILKAMDNLPVTVRLLDPPLHEFLPALDDLIVKDKVSGLNEDEKKLLEAAIYWHEFNPMLGVRGVRLGVLKPGLYEMQVQALIEAALEHKKQGGKPIVEIMIPLIISAPELNLALSWVKTSLDKVAKKSKLNLKVLVGTMIETPRAAILSKELASFVDFFSFGTNDLTQMTFGFSRDDIEGKMMSEYLDKSLIERNPFETLDKDGVGFLVKLSIQNARSVNPNIKLGVCGEHGGDPESIKFFYRAGLDYVSCSPYRVPIARLVGAQVVIESREQELKKPKRGVKKRDSSSKNGRK